MKSAITISLVPQAKGGPFVYWDGLADGCARAAALGFDFISKKRVEEVLAKKGRLTRWEMLRCRVRYFCDGAVLGTKDFVNGIFEAERHRFGPKRRSGARPLRYVESGGLTTLRDLRLKPLG